MESTNNDEVNLATPGVIDKYQAAGKVTNRIFSHLSPHLITKNSCFISRNGQMRRRCRCLRTLPIR